MRSLHTTRFSQIHSTIRTTDTISQAAQILEVSLTTLSYYLGNLYYKGDFLSYKTLKYLDKSTLKAYYKEAYDYPMLATRKIKTSPVISHTSPALIHQLVQESSTKLSVASYLGVDCGVLDKYFFAFLDGGYTYKSLKNISIEHLRQKHPGVYDQITLMPSLAFHPLSQIHLAIHLGDTETETAAILGVDENTLNLHLQTCSHFSWAEIKQRGFSFIYELYQDKYYKPLSLLRKYATHFSLARIHSVILASQSPYHALLSLNISFDSLRTMLSIFIKNNDTDSFLSTLKSSDSETIHTLFSDTYYRPIAELKPKSTTKTLNESTLSEIHQLVMRQSSWKEILACFGVSQSTLTTFLSRMDYNESVLTVTVLKQKSPEDLQKYYGDRYEETIANTTVELKNCPFSLIHQTVLASSSIENAASRFGCHPDTLARYLSHPIYRQAGLSFEQLKAFSITDLQAHYGEAYDNPFKLTPIDLRQLTPRQLHTACFEQSPHEAAIRLGVSSDALQRYQSLATFPEHTFFSTESNVLEELYLEDFDKPSRFKAPELSKVPLSTIHSVIRASQTLNEASIKLGVTLITLRQRITNLDLTFDTLKTTEEGQLGENYADDLILPREAPLLLTFAAMHEAIQLSTHKTEAATRLKINSTRLKSWLKQLSLPDNITLTFDYLKSTPRSSLPAFYQDHYDAPVTTITANNRAVSNKRKSSSDSVDTDPIQDHRSKKNSFERTNYGFFSSREDDRFSTINSSVGYTADDLILDQFDYHWLNERLS